MAILYNPQNVVVGLAVGYYAEVGSALPLDTIAFAGDWGDDWTNPGGTEDGWRLTGDTSTQSHTIEEQSNPVLTTLESRNLGMAASLAEDTLANMRLAFAGGTITTVSGTVKQFTLSDTIDEFMIGLDMKTVGGVCRRIIIPRASGAGTVDVAFRRSSSKRLWPVQFNSLCKPGEIIIKDITPA